MTQRLLALGAMLITPPFAFLWGIIGAILLWNVLEGADLPGWGRLFLALMAVPAVPGLWFIALPVIFGATRVTRAGGDEFQAWEDKQAKVWEAHRPELESLGRQRIDRVIASGEAATAGGVTITLVAVAMGQSGGDISLLQTAHRPTEDEEFALSDFMAELSDDVGSHYWIVAAPVEMTVTGARSHIAYVPGVPAAATELRLRITKILHLGDVEPLTGPWDFHVPLASRVA